VDLPILSSHLSDVPRKRWPSERQSFLTTLEVVEQAHKAGMIANPVYQDAKQAVNRAFERARYQLAERHVNAGKYRDLPSDIYAFWSQFSSPQLHTVGGYLKRAAIAAQRLDHPLVSQLLDLLREIAPLGVLFASLKTMVVKRVIKPVEERQPGYFPPQVSSEAQRQVVALLEEITQASYETLRATLAAAYAGWMGDYLEHADLAREHGKTLAPDEYFVKRRYPQFVAHEMVSLVVTTTVKVGQPLVYVSKPDWQAILTAKATEVADNIRFDFVHKNFRKIASIVEAKGNFTQGQVLSHTVDLVGLTGRLRFEFADGSSFVAQNLSVHVRNQYGTQFNRYPLTFHDVKLPGGTSMRLPSEERMNSIFIGKVAA
jgi:hypothetical protein